MLHLDHVALAVRDLDAADALFRTRYGLGSVEGGSHPEWGTANRIIPLGQHFIEVVGVTDPEVAAKDPVGHTVMAASARGPRFIGVALRSDDVEHDTRALALSWQPGSRVTGAGALTFRSAGLARSVQEGGGWPYFFDYDDPVGRLGQSDAGHRVAPRGISEVELHHDVEALRAYLHQDVVGLDVQTGAPELRAVTLDLASGRLRLPGLLT